MGSSKKDLLALPEEVVDGFGYALYLAQMGKKHDQAKPLKGFGSAGMVEIVEDWRGSATQRPDMELIQRRLAGVAMMAKESEL